MRRDQIIAYLALGLVALFVGFTFVTRFHDGRCHLGGRRGALNCAYPASP